MLNQREGGGKMSRGEGGMKMMIQGEGSMKMMNPGECSRKMMNQEGRSSQSMMTVLHDVITWMLMVGKGGDIHHQVSTMLIQNMTIQSQEPKESDGHSNGNAISERRSSAEQGSEDKHRQESQQV
jgi:hypothetical protein